MTCDNCARHETCKRCPWCKYEGTELCDECSANDTECMFALGGNI
jgi:hypothetical protein